eukprot:s419_g30.t1
MVEILAAMKRRFITSNKLNNWIPVALSGAFPGPFTPRSVMGPAASRHGLVLCDADVGVVNLPPGSAPYLREDLPQLRMLRKDPRIHCRLSEDGGLSESEAKSVAMARVSSLQVALSELAEGLVEAGQEASLELGTSAWLQCMEVTHAMGAAVQDFIQETATNQVEVAKQILEKPPGRMMRRRLRQRGAWGIVSHLTDVEDVLKMMKASVGNPQVQEKGLGFAARAKKRWLTTEVSLQL